MFDSASHRQKAGPPFLNYDSQNPKGKSDDSHDLIDKVSICKTLFR